MRPPVPRVAWHSTLGNVIRAAAAGGAESSWVSALPCRRRPARQPCRGRIIIVRSDPPAPIQWRCSVCDDEGEVAAALRELQLLDPDCERLVFGMRAHSNGAALQATDDELDELIGFVAAEANHEPNRRRQHRLDAAFDALNIAAQGLGGW